MFLEPSVSVPHRLLCIHSETGRANLAEQGIDRKAGATMFTPLAVALIAAFLGQAQPQNPEKATISKRRLEFMTKTLASYDAQLSEPLKPAPRLNADPVIRFTNPVGGLKDGAVFLWLDEGERPTVACQFYLSAEATWYQELSSLATHTLTLRSVEDGEWSPSKGGVEFKPIPDAPVPAATADQRLRQMRSLAGEFTAKHWYRRKIWNQIRLLSKPLARYGKLGSEALDGALFCFTHGTDPEVLLMIEERAGKRGPSGNSHSHR
jgi:hypothetical protein